MLPSPLTNGPTPLDLVLDLNERFATAVRLAKQSDRDKMLVMAGGWLHLQTLGGLAETVDAAGVSSFAVSDEIAGLLTVRGISNKVDAFNHCGQLVLGYVLDRIDEKKAKKDARNLVDRCAKLYRALRHFGEQEEHFPTSEAALADWIERNGGIDGLHGRYVTATAEPAVDDDGDDADLTEFADALDANAIEVKTDVTFATAVPILSLTLDSPDGVRILPLPSVPASVIADLARYLPAIDAAMPDRPRFWADIATICGVIERQDGEVEARPGDEPRKGAAMAPSHPIVWITSERQMTIAPSRRAAGVVVKVSARTGTGLSDDDMTWPRHLNGTATKALMAGMAGGFARASIEDARYDKNTHLMSFSTSNTRIAPFKFRTLATADFGSSRHHEQWTLDVQDYRQAAGGLIDMADGVVLPDLLTKFAAKNESSKQAIKVRVSQTEISVAAGDKASPVVIPGAGDTAATASVKVAASDLARVIRAVAELRPYMVYFAIDTGGLFQVVAHTGSMTARFYLPALLDGGARSPAKMVRVTKRASKPVVEPEAAEQPVLEAA